jgi:hypothetical protein
MVISHTKGGGASMRFYAPADDSSGGSKSGASANGGGDKSGGEVDLLDPKLFDQLPWNELDDETRATLNKIKEKSVATLQKASHLDKEFKRVDKLARDNQSRADRLAADANKKSKEKSGKGEGDGKQTVDDAYLTAVREELTESGFPPEQAEQLAPVFAKMFKRVGVIERERLGKDLQPMAAQVLATQAQDAFIAATQADELGMFQTPEVQQQVWDLVRERVNQGVDTTPEIVLNLAKMAWVDKQLLDKKGGKQQQQQNGEGDDDKNRRPMPSILPTQPPTMTTAGLFGAPSGQVRPIVHQQNDPNAPKHQLNDDTRNALAASFRSMVAGTNIRPKELASLIDKRR